MTTGMWILLIASALYLEFMWVLGRSLRTGEPIRLLPKPTGSPVRVVDGVVVEPSPNIPGIPAGMSIERFADEGLLDMGVFLSQQARRAQSGRQEPAQRESQRPDAA